METSSIDDYIHPTTQYALEVVQGLRTCCETEKLSCARHLSDLERQGTEGFPLFLMRAGRTGYLIGLKSAAVMFVGHFQAIQLY